MLRFVSRNLRARSLVRIIEEELISIGIIDDQESITPRTILNPERPSPLIPYVEHPGQLPAPPARNLAK